jgi:hypothetical protein
MHYLLRKIGTLSLGAMILLAGCDRKPNEVGLTDPNKFIVSFLGDEKLSFLKVSEGTSLELPVVIAVPSREGRSCVAIEFSRDAFDKRFLKDLFRQNLSLHQREQLLPFAARGVEAISIGNIIILNIFGGTMLHLRGDVLYPSGYVAFHTEKPIAKVAKVVGTVLFSSEHDLIKKKLQNYFVSSVGRSMTGAARDAIKLPDGSYVGRADLSNPDYQPYFQPRIENLENNKNISDFYCSGGKDQAQ